MPHRPNPIPRYNASNNPIQDQSTASTSRRDKDGGGLPPRHRASSWAHPPESTNNPSASTATVSGLSTLNMTSNSGGGGGRPTGRALPPPRFQRKQRPPRVQQAIAAASGSTSAAGASTQSSRRGGAGGNGGANASGSAGRPGTLTLGPANNWGAGTSAVVSLSMAAINAASARASVVHPRQQQPPPPPVQIPTYNPLDFEVQDPPPVDRSLDLGLGIPNGYDLEGLVGLDPVQLHNRITFGMGRTSTALRNELYTNDYVHLPNYSAGHPSPGGLEHDHHTVLVNGRDHPNPGGSRARSQSHHASPGYHPINTAHAQAQAQVNHAYSPIHPSSPYASSFGLETPPILQAAPHAPLRASDYDHQLRIRSQSLMAPIIDSAYRTSRDALSFLPPQPPPPPQAIPSHATFPPLESFSTITAVQQHNLILQQQRLEQQQYELNLQQYQHQQQLSLNTESDDIPTTGGRKPLKSALKRKSAPDLADQYPSHIPSLHLPSSDSDNGHRYRSGAAPLRPTEASPVPDPEFTLPDSLQSEYAHQLRLLQEEYATKAAMAEKRQRRSLERKQAATPGRRGSAEGLTVNTGLQAQSRGATATAASGNLDTTPPSSGGSGHRVAFFEEVHVIEHSDTADSEEQQHDGEGDGEGYLSWDEAWDEEDAAEGGEGDEDVTDFVYAPSHTGDDDDGSGAEGGKGGGKNENLAELSLTTEMSDYDEDGGSDVGDRGHDDTIRGAAVTGAGPESPTTQRTFEDMPSPVDSVISPVRAVIHGHEPSPVERPEGRHVGAQSSTSVADFPSLLPLVEVIAPTPVMASIELAPPEEISRFDEMDKEDGIVGVVAPVMHPMSSTSSTESSDSNSTLKNLPIGERQAEDGNTVLGTAPQEDAAQQDVDQGRTPTMSLVKTPTVSASMDGPSFPTGQTDQKTPEPGDGGTMPQLPHSLQRLAHRISRGTTIPFFISRPAPSIAQTSPVSPMQPGPSFEDYHPSSSNAYQDTLSTYSIDDDTSIRRLSSLTSLSSASSGLHGTVFPRPPQSYAPNPANRELLSGRSSAYSHESLHAQNRMPTRQTQQNQTIRRPHPDSVVPQQQSHRISRQSALVEYSSAASVESGSSHGGGTSGASHVHRARGRSVAGSMLSTSSSGSHHRNLRAPPGPPFTSSSIISASNSSPGMESLSSQASSEPQWDRGLLSNARSSESLGAVSAGSGKSAGSGGSGKGRALGGESIWTLGKEEEARWSHAPPSSSGHSTHSKDPTQFTLRSLVPQVDVSLPLSASEPFVVSRERIQKSHPDQYSYERLPPIDNLDYFYNPYSSSFDLSVIPPDRSRVLHQAITQSRSAPVFSKYEVDSSFYDDRREDYQPSMARQESTRYQEHLIPAPVAQLRAQAPSAPRYPFEERGQHLPPQTSSRSLPNMAPPSDPRPSDLRGSFDIKDSRATQSVEDRRMDASMSGHHDHGPHSGSSSRPSTGRSALYVGPGAGDSELYASRKSMVQLPATGGVFPRYQEVAASAYPDVAARPGNGGTARPGSSGTGRPGSAGGASGKIKSFFKSSRDSRLIK